MSYIVCRRARIIEMTYAPGNMIVGRLCISGKEYDFRTRGHIVNAVNKNWQNSNWKPTVDTTVIIDAEKTPGGIVIDSIEPFWPEAHQPIERLAPYGQRFVDALLKADAMTKKHRVGMDDDDGIPVIYVRWKDDVRVRLEDGRVANGIVLGIAAEDEIRFRIVDKKMGVDLPAESAVVEPVVLPMIGIPTLRLGMPVNLQSMPTRIRQAGNGLAGCRNPNKWVPGREYRPEGMPVRQPPPVAYDDPPGTIYDDVPF